MKKFIFLIILLVVSVLVIVRLFKTSKKQDLPTAKAPQTKVTIIEGWTLADIAKDLEYNPKRVEAVHLVNSSDFITEAKNFSTKDYPLLKSKPDSSSLEGFLFPDTYFLPIPGTSTNESELLIKKALDNFSLKFTDQMVLDAKAQNMSVFDIVILASIIERESGRNATTEQQKQNLDQERKLIAGLFYNRLNIGMPLQSDATVNYITKKNTPAISSEDSKIDSPYNTYMNKGLPPGPISNPSLSSLMAAIYPAKTNYLYFLSDPNTGKAIFAQTFEEHIINKQKYLR